MNNINEKNRCYIGSAKEIRYEKRVNGTWVEINPLNLKKNDIFRCFDKNTGSRLETERGDDTFLLYRDYDGQGFLPNGNYVL